MAKSEAPLGTDIADSGATVDTDEGEDNNAEAVSEAGSAEVVSSSPNAKRFLAGNSKEAGHSNSSQEVNKEKERKRRGRRVRNQTLVVAKKRAELGF